LIEFSGQAGTGKTNFCLQLIKTVSELGERSFYLSTQKPMSIMRANRLLGAHQELCSVLHVSFLEHQVDTIYHVLQPIAEQGSLRLVIIDSITGLLSDAFESTNRTTLISRADFLARQATVLKHLAHKYDFVLICINNVVANFKTDTVQPALGLAWANCVNERYMFTKHQQARELRALFSPHIPSDKSYTFRITDNGIESN
jgi:DNA-repair protein XRCC3